MISTQHLKRIIIGLVILAVGVIYFVQPIAQDPNYHHFADQRTILGIPHFWNVLSNAGFLMVGAYGLSVIHGLKIVVPLRLAYVVFFLGVSLVAFGSGYYHWTPSNETLLWDRLPMTLAFMALMSVVLAEFLSVDWGRVSLWPLLLIGLTSVVYWFWGERHGAGDLRWYVLVQFLPVVLIFLLLLAGRNLFDRNSGYWWLFASYVLAKVLEHFDALVYAWTAGIMSGHALKHLCAAFGVWALLRCYRARARIYP